MISTLIFAYKASSIVNTVSKSEEQASNIINSLRRRVKELEGELSNANVQIDTLSSLLERQSLAMDPSRNTKKEFIDANSTHVYTSLYERIEDIASREKLKPNLSVPTREQITERDPHQGVKFAKRESQAAVSSNSQHGKGIAGLQPEPS
jgi:hypothetical protein